MSRPSKQWIATPRRVETAFQSSANVPASDLTHQPPQFTWADWELRLLIGPEAVETLKNAEGKVEMAFQVFIVVAAVLCLSLPLLAPFIFLLGQ